MRCDVSGGDEIGAVTRRKGEIEFRSDGEGSDLLFVDHCSPRTHGHAADSGTQDAWTAACETSVGTVWVTIIRQT